MTEQNNENIRLKIENNLAAALSGDMLKNAQDFVVYLLENGMMPDPIQETSIRFNYMGEMTCIVIFFKDVQNPSGIWFICDTPIREHDGFPLDEDLQEFARTNVRICRGECGCPDWPRGGDKTIFGKEYKSVCSSEIGFTNPDADALGKVKKLMEYWMLVIADSKKKQ